MVVQVQDAQISAGEIQIRLNDDRFRVVQWIDALLRLALNDIRPSVLPRVEHSPLFFSLSLFPNDYT
jgi:hypothetical protein